MQDHRVATAVRVDVDDTGVAVITLDVPADGFSASPVQPTAFRVRKLVIAAVKGHAIGMGFSIGDCQAHYALRHAVGLARGVPVNANPASLAISKRMLWAHLDAETVEREETSAHRILMSSPDAAEGAAAWRERRSPRWTSRASETGDPA